MSDPDPIATVLAYHERTKHHPDRYARSLGYLDWANQPDPFRRYEGAAIVPLAEVPPTPEPAFNAIFRPTSVPPRAVSAESIAQLLYDSLAISAWKSLGGERWALRVNPSSGNLHPTEGYLVAGPVAGLTDRPGVHHYAPYRHGLETRCPLSADEWGALTEGLPSGTVFVGLTSIHWRESWKYGERAFRYCQHDVGHAIGAITAAAACLGWSAHVLPGLSDAELDALLGVADQAGPEAEHADCLIALAPADQPVTPDQQRAYRIPPSVVGRLSSAAFAGRPNTLSAETHDWPVIDSCAEAARCIGRLEPDVGHDRPGDEALAESAWAAIPARRTIRERRSARAMDGATSLSAAAFYRLMEALMPRPGRWPYAALPWLPAADLALFVHRVDGLAPGLYALLRGGDGRACLRSHTREEFTWRRPRGCPERLPLYLLMADEAEEVARTVSCHQDIACDGCFSLGMVSAFEPRIRAAGAWTYKRLFWETGVIGQVLYLAAEAEGVRGTGIGCFFDDAMHEILGLRDHAFQSLYHFTVGGPVPDERLETLPAYAHLNERP